MTLIRHFIHQFLGLQTETGNFKFECDGCIDPP
jgi:hypothetical protein